MEDKISNKINDFIENILNKDEITYDEYKILCDRESNYRINRMTATLSNTLSLDPKTTCNCNKE
jgi:hypothetical protein